jgi:hypothetical protein
MMPPDATWWRLATGDGPLTEDPAVSTKIHVPSRLLLALVALLALSLVSATAVLALTTKLNGGAVKAVRTATADDPVSTTSSSWTDVPGMSTTVNVPSGTKALLVITFSGQSRCNDSGASPTVLCYVRALVNGVDASPGITILDSAAAGDNTAHSQGAHSFQWVMGVNAGTKTVKIQWLVNESGDAFHLISRSMTVLRTKGYS